MAIVLSAALPVVTVSAPVSDPAAISPTNPVTTSAADPANVSAVFCASKAAFTVTTSLPPLALIEVAAEPVVMLMPLSAALPVVTFKVPVNEPAATSPTSPVTTSAADPVSVSAVFCASVVAFTVTVSPAPLALIEVAAEPVAIDMPLSAASPVVTLSVPVSDPAAISPTSPVTTSAAEPVSVSAVFCASVVALTVTVSPAPLALIEVAAEPVAIDMPLSAALPVVTLSVPVSDPAAISPTNPVTTSAAEPASVSAVFCASAVAVTVTVSVLKLSVFAVADEPVVMAIVLSVASPVVTVSAPVSELAVIFPISPLTISAEEPTSVSTVLLASAVVSTLSVTPLESVMLVAPVPVLTFTSPALAALAPSVMVLAPVNLRVSILVALRKLASVSVAAAVTAITSLPDPPAMVAAAHRLAAAL